jgi:hypothetical protein
MVVAAEQAQLITVLVILVAAAVVLPTQVALHQDQPQRGKDPETGKLKLLTKKEKKLRTMKPYLFIFGLLLASFSSLAQTPTISSLVVAGSNIKWYDSPAGGTQYTSPGTTNLVNGQIYYASQTVNGVESTARVAVTANLTIVAAPATGTHTPAQTQVIWNWNSVSGATGYKWSTTNLYSGATDQGTAITTTETGLTCNTAYTRYAWAYNASGCVSAVTTLTQTTSACGETPWSGSLSGFGTLGGTYTFLVTGTTSGGSIWGCDIYTDDSHLAKAAVHDGWVADGVTKHISVTIVAGQSSYSSCTWNGITSTSYGVWPRSYQINSSW